jgi:hypothetical protein
VSDERDEAAATPDEPGTPAPEAGKREGPDAAAEERPRRGRIRQQDETTTPREPTLAERRARERAARREREAEEQRLADEATGRKKRKRILVGAGVTVGVVALIAVGYSAAQPDEEVAANCVDNETGVVVDDSNCAVPASNPTYYGGGGFFPIFIGGGGRQYHYNYGGTGVIGQPVSGGTTVVPKDGTKVRTSSGSSTVTRGGLGVSRSSSSSVGGSKSGGSKSGPGSIGGGKSGGS